MNKSILFLILAFVCIWLVLDQVVGNQYLAKFVIAIVPGADDFAGRSTTHKVETEDGEEYEFGGGGKKF